MLLNSLPFKLDVGGHKKPHRTHIHTGVASARGMRVTFKRKEIKKDSD